MTHRRATHPIRQALPSRWKPKWNKSEKHYPKPLTDETKPQTVKIEAGKITGSLAVLLRRDPAEAVQSPEIEARPAADLPSKRRGYRETLESRAQTLKQPLHCQGKPSTLKESRGRMRSKDRYSPDRAAQHELKSTDLNTDKHHDCRRTRRTSPHAPRESGQKLGYGDFPKCQNQY